MQSIEPDPETAEEFGALNDALDSVGSSPWLIAVTAVILIGAVAFWIYYRRIGGSRDTAIQNAAVQAGYRYTSTHPELSRVRMRFFGGGEPGIQHVVVKPCDDGTDIRAFEFIPTRLATKIAPEQNVDGLGTFELRTVQRRQLNGAWRTGGTAKLPAYLPRLVITTEKTSRKALNLVGADDIELESDEFNRMFDVRTENRNFAHAFLDAQMIDFMIQTGGDVEFETFGQWIMLCMDRVAPVEMPAVCNLVTAFKSNVPSLILTDYMLPSERESLARPPAGFEPSHFGNAWHVP